MSNDPIELFLSLLKKSGLASHVDLDSHLNELRGSSVGSQDEVAAKLIEKGILTQYQAKKLLLGQGEECVLAGRYHILERIGTGGMGHVFKALDTKMDRVVAIKIMTPHHVDNPDAVQRFKREAKALAALALPNVVKAFDSGEDNGRNFLVMEYVQGLGLEQLLAERGQIPPTVAADYIYQVAIGMSRAHSRGMVHRDLKPSNLLLGPDGEIKILDLGLARFLQDQLRDGTLTRDNTGLGTPDYMPPEQFRDARRVDHRADIYSLGCTLYHLISGQVPFPGSSFSEKADAHEKKQPPPLQERCREVPLGLAQVVYRMMAKRPADRYQNMREVAEAIAPYVAGSSPSFPTLDYTVSYQELTRRNAKRWKWVGAVSVCVALLSLVSALIVFSYFPGFAEDTNEPPIAEIPNNKPDINKPKTVPPANSDKNAPTKEKPETKKPSEIKIVEIADGWTVAKDGTGQFQTINDALAKVTDKKKRILILDDGVYEESVVLSQPAQHGGVVLESKGNATLVPQGAAGILIRNVPNVTITGLRVEARNNAKVFLVAVIGHCPGVKMHGLHLSSKELQISETLGIDLEQINLRKNEQPVVISTCQFNHLLGGVRISGMGGSGLSPISIGRIIVSDNEFQNVGIGLYTCGDVYETLVAGNRFLDCEESAIQLVGPASKSRSVWLTNNTMLRCNNGVELRDLQGIDEIGKKQTFSMENAKDFVIKNNLILQPFTIDMTYVVGGVVEVDPLGSKDGNAIGKLFSLGHNWREFSKPEANSYYEKGWIPPAEKNGSVLEKNIQLISRQPGNEDFLRPASDSRLATKGAGTNHPAFPSYVGAVAPKGAAPWNWQHTWTILTTNTLTVSKNESDTSQFGTINAALEKVQPGMTIRVLDDAVYSEEIRLVREPRFAGITIEATNNAVLEWNADNPKHMIHIVEVSNVTIQGFRFTTGKQYPRIRFDGNQPPAIISVEFGCPGIRLENLVMESKCLVSGIEIKNCDMQTDETPVLITKCKIDVPGFGITTTGLPSRPCRRVRIIDNFVKCGLTSMYVEIHCQDLQIAGNVFAGGDFACMEMRTLQEKSGPILLTNNTFFGGQTGLRLWRELPYGFTTRQNQVHLHNNLFLKSTLSDIAYVSVDEKKQEAASEKNEKLLKDWIFSGNWRDLPQRPPIIGLSLSPNDKELTPQDYPSIIEAKDDFLRPNSESPLANGGVDKSNDSIPLPRYVGALPPQETQRWDWQQTWQAWQKFQEQKSD